MSFLEVIVLEIEEMCRSVDDYQMTMEDNG
nr:MAG TPA: hypothetical protein [Caudoviricetes sp.]